MTSDQNRLVVVGASLAGLRAVQAARRAGYAGPISLVGSETHLPYDRPPLSKAYLEAAAAPEVIFHEEQHLREELGVDLLLGSPATGLDVAAREVHVAGRRPLPYDALVIATGATARVLPGGEGLSGVHQLRTLDDAVAVRAALDAGARTVVVGAGFIGSEVASGARKRGLPATIVEAAPVPLSRAIGVEMGSAIAELHHREGTRLLCGTGVSGLIGEGRVRGVRLTDGTELEADLVVVGIGAAPATGWLAGSGVEVGDGVVCDATLAARGAANVYAAGDVARWHNELFGVSMRVEHWHTAAEQGAAAARNALGSPSAYTTVPYFWSDWYGRRIQFVGTAVADEVRLVAGGVEEGKLVALYRSGGRLTGALLLNGPAQIMKYRGLIARRATWAEALTFAEEHPLIRAAA